VPGRASGQNPKLLQKSPTSTRRHTQALVTREFTMLKGFIAVA